MAEDDIARQTDKVAEQEKRPEKSSENAAHEATDSMGDLVKAKRDAMADQKDPERLADPKRAKFASFMLGRPEIFDPASKDGQVLLPGMDARAKSMAAKDALHLADTSRGGGGDPPTGRSGDGAAAKAEPAPQAPELAVRESVEPGRQTSDTQGGLAGKQLEEFLKTVAPQPMAEGRRPGEGGQPIDDKSRPEGKLAVPDSGDFRMPWQEKHDAGGGRAQPEIGKDGGWVPVDESEKQSGWERVDDKPKPERSYELDQDGDLKRVNNPDGSSIRREGEPAVWRDYDKDGKASHSTYGDVDITGDGRLRTEKDGTTTFKDQDGSEEIHTDDSVVYKNPEGQVTQTLDKGAEPITGRSYSYDGNPPALNKVENSDGSSIRKEGDPPVWREYDKDGKETRNTYDDVDVHENGSLRLEKDGETTFKHPDGTEEVHTDDSVVYKNPEGKVTQTLDKGAEPITGRSYSYEGNPPTLNKVENSDGSSIRKEGDPPVWRDYDKDGKATRNTYDDVEVHDTGSLRLEKDGETTFKHADGSQEIHTDDSVVYKNRDGQVTQTLDKGAEPMTGRSYSYEGNPPTLNKVENSDGSSIRKEGDPPVWREYDKGGKATRNTYDDVEVHNTGSLRLEKDRESTFKHPDGAEEVHTDDSVVYKNRDGQVTQTLEKKADPPRGQRYSYDEQGNLNEVESLDGSSVRKEGDPPAWRVYDENGKATRDTYDDVDVHDDGRLRLEKDGTTTIHGPDGTTDVYTDKSVVYKDRNGDVTQTLDTSENPPTGRSYKYEGTPPSLHTVENSDGSSIRKVGDPPVWREFDKDGKATRKTYDDVVVYENGSLGTEKDGKVTYKNPDGTQEIETNDSTVYKDRQGRVTEVVDHNEEPPTGRRYSYDEQTGQPNKVENSDGSSIRKEGEPPVWQEYGKDGKPTDQTYDKVYSDDNGNLVTEKDGLKRTTSLDGTIKSESEGMPTEIEHPNGAFTTIRKDGTSVTEYPDGRTVDRDAKDRATLAKYPNDTLRSFEYGRDGLTQVNNLSDGTRLVKGDDGVWREFTEGGDDTGKAYKDVKVDKKGNVIRTPLEGRTADQSSGASKGNAVESQPEKPRPGKADSREDVEDRLRSGFTRHDDPAKIEQARNELSQQFIARGSATDLDLMRMDALNDVLTKARKDRGIPEPDTYQQLGIPKSGSAPASSLTAGPNSPQPGGLPREQQPANQPTDLSRTASGGRSSEFVQYSGEGDLAKLSADEASERLPKPPNREEFLKKHSDLSPAPEKQEEYRRLQERLQKEGPLLSEKKGFYNQDFNELKADVRKAGGSGAIIDLKYLEKTIATLPEAARQKFRERLEKLKEGDKEIKELEGIPSKLKEMEGNFAFEQGLKKIDSLPDAQRNKVYESIDRILNDKSDRWTEAERKQIASELINQIGDPDKIRQGIKDTCSAAVNESELIRTHPDKYAGHVASLVTEGRLLGKEVLKPDQAKGEDGEPNRSLTSRIYQTGVLSLALADRTPPAAYANLKWGQSPPGEARLGTRADVDAGLIKADDVGKPITASPTGEWINVNGKWEPFRGNELRVEEMLKLKNDLTADKKQPEKFELGQIQVPASPDEVAQQLKALAEGKDGKPGRGYPIQLLINREHTVLVTGVTPPPEPAGFVRLHDPTKPRGQEELQPIEQVLKKLEPTVILRKSEPKKE